ncbi:MAG: hypothetical protein DRP56_02030, partial [Planctomycetota bacterium]
MTLLTRKRVIKVALETVKGTKVAGTQALFAFNTDIKPAAPFAERKGAGLYLGHNETGILGEGIGTCSFKVELRGAATAAIEPGIAMILQAAGLKDNSGYKPTSAVSDQKTLSIDVWEDGVKKGLAGAMGTVT